MVHHGPTVLITTWDERHQRPNIMPATWTMPLGKTVFRVVLSVEKENYTHTLISQTGLFIINVPTYVLKKEVAAVGKCHGNVVDKFSKLVPDLTQIPASNPLMGRIPRIAQCIGHVECKVEQRIDFDHLHCSMFVSEVLALSANDDVPSTTYPFDSPARNVVLYLNKRSQGRSDPANADPVRMCSDEVDLDRFKALSLQQAGPEEPLATHFLSGSLASIPPALLATGSPATPAAAAAILGAFAKGWVMRPTDFQQVLVDPIPEGEGQADRLQTRQAIAGAVCRALGSCDEAAKRQLLSASMDEALRCNPKWHRHRLAQYLLDAEGSLHPDRYPLPSGPAPSDSQDRPALLRQAVSGALGLAYVEPHQCVACLSLGSHSKQSPLAQPGRPAPGRFGNRDRGPCYPGPPVTAGVPAADALPHRKPTVVPWLALGQAPRGPAEVELLTVLVRLLVIMAQGPMTTNQIALAYTDFYGVRFQQVRICGATRRLVDVLLGFPAIFRPTSMVRGTPFLVADRFRVLPGQSAAAWWGRVFDGVGCSEMIAIQTDPAPAPAGPSARPPPRPGAPEAGREMWEECLRETSTFFR
ncbi:hypothetical protein PAPYR_941 [Paratrimastix pyriformis]|uniref:Flavin reductase like domain-containing protein n=1 Tax=Paratrimastix pyriformis TaxID=342808 RepID=A0ABQ8UT73_9EUKA|nr:hypothetical protein PAPYR_941 [Paratrimastix pyriformis]